MIYFHGKKLVKLILVTVLFFNAFLLSGCIDLAINHNKHNLNKKSAVEGEVYTMRGGLGGIFSKGMNHLEDTLADDYHIYASSTVWFRARNLSDTIIRRYRAGLIHGPIILVGHSLGANDQIGVARILYHANIPVALLITVDPVLPLRVPPNVKQVVNIYKRSFVPMFSGLSLKADDPKLTQIENLNTSTLKGTHVNHFNIDEHKITQKIMLESVLAVLKGRRRPS
jgi:hypothetical protein